MIDRSAPRAIDTFLGILRERRFLNAAGALLAVYLVTLVIMPKHVFWTPDEGAKWMAMHSTWFQGDITYTVDFPSQRVDTEYKYLPHYGLFPKPQIASDGSIYLAFETPVLFPLLSSIPYRVFGITGIYFLPLLCGWLVAVVAGLIGATIRRDSGPATVLLAGLATPLWFYSQLFWEHTPASLLGIIAIAIVALAPPRNLTALLIATALPFAASAFRMELLSLAAALPIAWGLAGYLAGPQRNQGENAPVLKLRWPLPRWTLPIVAIIVAVGIAAALDALLTVRHHKLVGDLPNRLWRGWYVLTNWPWTVLDILIHASMNEAAPVGDSRILTTLLGAVLCTAAPFARRPRIEGMLLFGGVALLLSFSIPLLLQWNMYRAVHGVVPIAPFMVIWLYAWAAAKREERGYPLVFLTLLVSVYFLTTVYVIATTYVEQGQLDVGIEWGQRYLLTLYPIAAVLCVLAVRTYWDSARPAWLRKSFVAAVTLMAFVAVGFQVRGLGMLYNTRTRLVTWDAAMRQEGPVVTDLWWLPAAVAVLFTEHELYYVHKRREVADWVAEARARGIKGFAFASVEAVEPADLPGAAVVRTETEPKDLDGINLTRFVITSGDR